MKLPLKYLFAGLLIFLCTLSARNYEDDFLLASIQQGSGGTNLYTGNNAAQPTPGEVNGTANTRNGGGAYTITSATTPTPFNGTYFLRWERNSTSGNSDGLIDLDGMPLAPITITLRSNVIIGDPADWQLRMTTPNGWTSIKNQNFVLGAGWVEQSITGTPTVSDPTLVLRGTSSATDGDVVGVDYIIITQD